MSRTLVTLAALISLVTTSVAQAPAIDGFADPAYGPPLVVQNVGTSLGDADLGDVSDANGSELDVAYGYVHAGVLYLVLSGNLQPEAHRLNLFFNSMHGGQNRLRGDNPNVGALLRPCDAGGPNGLQFDVGFDADYHLSLSIDAGGMMAAYWAELWTTGGGRGRTWAQTSRRGTRRSPVASTRLPSGVRGTTPTLPAR